MVYSRAAEDCNTRSAAKGSRRNIQASQGRGPLLQCGEEVGGLQLTRTSWLFIGRALAGWEAGSSAGFGGHHRLWERPLLVTRLCFIEVFKHFYLLIFYSCFSQCASFFDLLKKKKAFEKANPVHCFIFLGKIFLSVITLFEWDGVKREIPASSKSSVSRADGKLRNYVPCPSD